MQSRNTDPHVHWNNDLVLVAGVLLLSLLLSACTDPTAICRDRWQSEAGVGVSSFNDQEGRRVAEGRARNAGEAVRGGASSWESALRLGPWRYWYADGQLKAKVRYSVDCYVHCCALGPCDLPYDFLTGDFELWHPNGQLMAKGVFEATERHIDSNCEGGEMLRDGDIPSEGTCWNEEGEPVGCVEVRERLGDLNEWLGEGLASHDDRMNLPL